MKTRSLSRLVVAGAVVPTGGLGTGNSLASQGGIVRDGRRLLVVNAGDNTVTSFAITRDGLSRRDVEPSGGIRPVSVTVHDDVVYVLNTGSDSVSGFHINDRGNLTPIANSARALSTTGTGAAEVKFTHDGDALIVTEKATNTIDTFEVSDDGVAGAATFTASVGVVPYGFDIDRRDHVVVSEAATGSVSSYRFDDGALSGDDRCVGRHPGRALQARHLDRRSLRLHDQRRERHHLVVPNRPRRLPDAAGRGGRHDGCGPDRRCRQQRRRLPLRTCSQRRCCHLRDRRGRFTDQPGQRHRRHSDRLVGPRRLVTTRPLAEPTPRGVGSVGAFTYRVRSRTSLVACSMR